MLSSFSFQKPRALDQREKFRATGKILCKLEKHFFSPLPPTQLISKERRNPSGACLVHLLPARPHWGHMIFFRLCRLGGKTHFLFALTAGRHVRERVRTRWRDRERESACVPVCVCACVSAGTQSLCGLALHVGRSQRERGPRRTGHLHFACAFTREPAGKVWPLVTCVRL